MRPIADAGDQAVPDPIDVTILDVAAKILIVADQRFPATASASRGFRTAAAQCATLIAPYVLADHQSSPVRQSQHDGAGHAAACRAGGWL